MSSVESVTGRSAEEFVIGPNSSESTMSQMWLWLCDGDSLRTQEVERPPWEAGTRGLEAQQTKRAQYVL
jgi:hypothetical protein